MVVNMVVNGPIKMVVNMVVNMDRGGQGTTGCPNRFRRQATMEVEMPKCSREQAESASAEEDDLGLLFLRRARQFKCIRHDG